MEMVLSSDASNMDRTLGPTEKDFIQRTHLACGDTRQLSTVDGTRLRGKLKKKELVWRADFSPAQAQSKLPGSGGQKDPTRRVKFMCSSSVLIFKLAFSEAMSFPDPLYHRFAAEDSLVGHEDLGPSIASVIFHSK